MATCAHCGEAVPNLASEIAAPRYCCPGCAAAASFVAELGLIDYYRLRSAQGGAVAAQRAPFDWDAAAFQRLYVRRADDGDEIALDLDGVRCAACAWLIERALRSLPGVLEVAVNASSARLHLRWDSKRTTLGAVLASLQRLGYQPIAANDATQTRALARRDRLLRLAVAGIGAMQAMMFAEALYFGADSLHPATRDFLRWLGLLLAAPVVFYAGAPFLRGALIEWKARRPGMDSLVAGSVLLAFFGSFIETLRGGAAVYFDSAVMFVFLLLATRHIERVLRERAQSAVQRIANAAPAFARRRRGDQIETVALVELAVGDHVVLRPDDVAPADGRLLSAVGAFDEALLSGEGTAQARRAGDAVLAGSVCLARAVEFEVTRIGSTSTLALLAQLIERAQAQRPQVALLADRYAGALVWILLGTALLTALGWSWFDASRALPATLAVLAASCPCALSLAVPATLAAVHAHLAARGVLVLDGDALERLASVDYVVLDKTGTLTEGSCRLAKVLTKDIGAARALGIAAALEAAVPHPLARAFAPYADSALCATELQVLAGQGVVGVVDGESYRCGSPAFTDAADDAAGDVVLRGPRGVVAGFVIEDPLRANAEDACRALRDLGCQLRLLSGDSASRTQAVAERCAIEHWGARLRPEDKLAAIGALQAQGHRVAMLGDGLNDAAVLAQADVGVAMASGAALAQTKAGIVLLRNDPAALIVAIKAARAARRVMRQNLAWAAIYNLAMVPLAALAWVAPWVAAVGMCLSSLLVTLNAVRLARAPRAAQPNPAPATWRTLPA